MKLTSGFSAMQTAKEAQILLGNQSNITLQYIIGGGNFAVERRALTEASQLDILVTWTQYAYWVEQWVGIDSLTLNFHATLGWI